MSGLKTVETGSSVDDFLASVTPDIRHGDGKLLCALMERITG